MCYIIIVNRHRSYTARDLQACSTFYIIMCTRERTDKLLSSAERGRTNITLRIEGKKSTRHLDFIFFN